MMIWANVVNSVRIDKFLPCHFSMTVIMRAHQPVFDFYLHSFTWVL